MKLPIEMNFIRPRTGGTIILSTTIGRWCTPSMCGSEWPYTSASIRPTCWPSASSAAARLTVSEDLPTPPLPLATAITRVRGSSEIDFSGRPPRSFVVSAAFSSGLITSNRSSTRSTFGSEPTCSATWSWKELRSGQPATVSAIVTETALPSMTMSRTMSSSVTG